MSSDVCRMMVSRKPGRVVMIWLTAAIVVVLCAPDLTRLAAEGQAKLLGNDAESRKAAESLRKLWPDQAYESMAVAVLLR